MLRAVFLAATGLDTSVLTVRGGGDVTCSGGAGVTNNPLWCIRSGAPHSATAAVAREQLTPGIRIEEVAFTYAYETGYAGPGGAAFNLTVGGALVYASPVLDDHNYSKAHPAYGAPIAVHRAGIGAPVQADRTVALTFANYDRNLQLLLPLSVNITCSGAGAPAQESVA